MRVNIGPYPNWIGPYQIAEILMFWKARHHSEADALVVHNFGTFLDKNVPGLNWLCNWIHSKKKQREEVHVDRHDVWAADYTLALIITPVLKLLKETKQGAPHVDDEDVPEHLRSTSAPALTEQEKDIGTTDQLWHQRWEHVLSEMIWAFEQHCNNDFEEQFYSGNVDVDVLAGKLVESPDHTFEVDHVGLQQAHDRRDNGRRLFAKYYNSLWN